MDNSREELLRDAARRLLLLPKEEEPKLFMEEKGGMVEGDVTAFIFWELFSETKLRFLISISMKFVRKPMDA